MDKLPNEMIDAIVSELHGEFCNCSSTLTHPTAWHSARCPDRWHFWDTGALRHFQQELCSLRLVDKRFYAAATRYFKSHASFCFGRGLWDQWDILRKVQYWGKEANQGTISQITGVYIDLEFLNMLGQHVLTPTTAAGEETESGDDDLVYFEMLKAPFTSATSLEMRLRESDLYDHGVTGPFIRENMPNLTDLALDCPSATAVGIFGRLEQDQCDRLRSILVSSAGGNWRVSEYLTIFRNLTELSLHNLVPGPILLHPEHQGLTRLNLSHVTTSAAHLLATITRGPTSEFPMEPRQLGNGSPLEELILTHVKLDTLPRRNGTEEESGTWSQVFNTIAESCKKLKYLEVEYFSYGVTAARRPMPGQGRAADLDALRDMTKLIRARSGAEANVKYWAEDGETILSL